MAYWRGIIVFFRLRREKGNRFQGREAVNEVVTQPYNALDNAKESLKESEEKNKTALESADKELKQ